MLFLCKTHTELGFGFQKRSMISDLGVGEKGYGATEIASEMGITRTSVYRALNSHST